MDESIVIDQRHPAKYWHTLADGRLQRDLCPRDWYDIRHYDLKPQGTCAVCGTRIAGRFGEFGKPFGPRRIPVHMQSCG